MIYAREWECSSFRGRPFDSSHELSRLGSGSPRLGSQNDGNGDIWTSTNGGLTWIDHTPHSPGASASWGAVASNADGDHLVAIARSAIWIN
jgi:hypothetical protein